MRQPAICFSAILVLLAGTAAAQPTPPPPQMPARDQPQATAVGTASIKGRVIDAQTGNAVVRARVRLVRMGGPGPQGAPITTDDLGAFVFNSLPAGSYL